jgi:dephospho-CoA kinase
MEEIRRRLEASEALVCGIVEIPLLFETGVPPWVTDTMFVTASKETRANRCRKRGWSEAEMAKRESFFLASEERMKRSDYVIRNDGSLEELKKAVEKVYAKAICPKTSWKEANQAVTSAQGGL